MRTFLTVVIGLALLAETAWAGERSQRSEFTVFDAMGYGQPDTSVHGLVRFVCFYYIFPGDTRPYYPLTARTFAAGKLPDKAAFLDAVRKHTAKRTGPIVMDIEGVYLSGEPKIVKPRFRLFVTLAKWAKEAAPDRMIGYYGHGLFPEPPGKEYRAQAKELAEAVDAFFPSMYTFNDDRTKWRKKLESLVAEARQIAPRKPIYPFVWPQYHDGTPLQFTFLTGEHWRWQLNTIRQSGADGVVLWGARRYENAHVWREQADWWQETIGFMRSLKDGEGK